MSNLTLRQLRYVLALTEAGHFGKAAAASHVSQPALSQQIKLIEEMCGGALFERGGGRAVPTSFGREFIARAEKIVADSAELTRFALEHRGRPSRPLGFGLIPTIAPYLLPDIFPGLRQAFPDLDFAICEGRTEQLLARLRAGELDLCVLATAPPEQDGFAEAELFADPFVVAMPAAAGLSERVAAAELAKAHVLLLDEGHCFRDQAIAACALRDDTNSRTFAATSLTTIVEFVAQGQGVTLLPALSLRKEASDPRIRIAALAPPGASRQLRLVWRQATPFAALYGEIATIIRRDGQQGVSARLPDRAVSASGRRSDGRGSAPRPAGGY